MDPKQVDSDTMTNVNGNHNWHRRANEVKDYVRANLNGDLRLESVSRVAHSSPYHFHRIFAATCGETLGAFTRRARLERAAYLMKSSRERGLESIAVEVGFPGLSEFSRAFKRQYGTSPGKWDRVSPLTAVADCMDDRPRATRSFEPRIAHNPACRLAYIRMQTWFEVDKLKPGFARLTDWLERRDVLWRKLPLIGMSWDNYQTTPLEKVRYDFAFPVPAHVQPSEEIGIYTLPAMTAVEVRCTGELSVVAEAWDFLYDSWFPTSRSEPADLPAMKRFCRHPDELGWAEWDLYCSIALRPEMP